MAKVRIGISEERTIQSWLTHLLPDIISYEQPKNEETRGFFKVMHRRRQENHMWKKIKKWHRSQIKRNKDLDHFLIQLSVVDYVHTMVEPPLPISNREVKHHLAELVLR